MWGFFRICALPVLLAASAGQPASAQQDNLRVAVANLNEDVRLLAQQVRTLRLEVEALQRENSQLRAQVAAASNDEATRRQMADLAAAVEALRREYRAADEAQKKAVVEEFSRQIDALASQTQGALNVVAQAVESRPAVSAPVRFNDDYPKTGLTYTVRPGDTLSRIAQRHNSSIKDIQNANKIADPRSLQVGQTIFIPIPE